MRFHFMNSSRVWYRMINTTSYCSTRFNVTKNIFLGFTVNKQEIHERSFNKLVFET